MDTRADTQASPYFLNVLSEALNHIYNPNELCRSPLAERFGVADRYDTSAALRRILTEAIYSLEPPRETPAQSTAWRMYYSLLYRYVEQQSQSEVADQLAISTRQLRRDQHAARQLLADRLWKKYRLRKTPQREEEQPKAEQGAELDPAVNEELRWLKESSPQESGTDLDQALPPVLNIARTLADEHSVRLHIEKEEHLPTLSIYPVALRQILITLLSVVIPRAAGGDVNIRVTLRRWKVELTLECPHYPSGSKPPLDEETSSLNMAHHLVTLCSAEMDLSADKMMFKAQIAFPILEQSPVLVIDDNADTLELLRRYATGTRYHVVGTQHPEKAAAIAKKIEAQIIVLDVMMPQTDGWEMLERLRQNPATGRLPIVVCTILAQKELAYLLGADAFIRKPVTQQAFLATLDEQMKAFKTKTQP